MPDTTDHPQDTGERRAIVRAGLAFFGALVVLIAVAALFSRSAGDAPSTTTTTFACDPGDSVCLAAQQERGRPGIIPEPGSGAEPDEAGDRGGALQIAVFVLLVAGVGAIVALVVRSSRRARTGADDARVSG